MRVPERIAAAAQKRIAAADTDINRSVEAIQSGFPLRAEPVEMRKVERVATVARVDLNTAKLIADEHDPVTLGLEGESLSKAEAIQGKTVDYLGVAWLDAARLATGSVARIVFHDGRPDGSGFLISDCLLMTNNHVIPDRAAAAGMLAEFRYELELGKRTASPVRFALDPDKFFETDERDDLDFTIVALGKCLGGGTTEGEFGKCPISESGAKHSVGEPVNIVEHPDGDYKQVVVRDNRIVHRGDTVLHYLTDTEPGSSGSPVFNDQWQVVALHHWGGPHREVSANGKPLAQAINEGIRVSCIVKELQSRAPKMSAGQRAMLQEAMNAPPPSDFGARIVAIDGGPGPLPVSAPVTVPRETEVRPSGAREASGGAPANRIDRHYSNRRGYNPRFLRNFPLPAPQLNGSQRASAARVRGVGESANPFELKYEHFSVVVNAERRMAFYSVCNIDGSKRIRVDRKTGQAVTGPEAVEAWATDPRIPEEAQLSDEFYERLRRDLRVSNDYFARGHLTRREDPDWGSATAAEKANDDTYHHTNACPQVNTAFNASKKAWQGVENFILNSADDENLKATVITGPVFRDDDPVYEDEEFGPIRVPRRFWKIVAYVEDGDPKVFAILADQGEMLDKLIASRGEAREAAFEWPRALSKDYQSTVEEIAELTGLDFGDLANHDVFAGGGESLEKRVIHSAEALFPDRRTEGGFGAFPSIGGFLERWEESRRSEAGVAEEAARPRPDRPPAPAPRARRVVEVGAEVARIFGDDLSGAKHQQFSVKLEDLIEIDERVKEDVQATLDRGFEVRLAVRFGDGRGLPDRIPGIRSGVNLRIKGEWIPADEAFAVGGERTAVLHFTHDPLGFICTPVKCFN